MASRSVAGDTELVATDEAKAGVEFTAANGTAIKYYGNKKINGISDDGVKVGMEVAVADVKKTLAAVGSICDAGNRVIFEADGGEIVNKKTGETIKMKRERGVYNFNIWVKRNAKGRIPGVPRDTTTVFTLADGKVVTKMEKKTNEIQGLGGTEVVSRVTVDSKTGEVIECSSDF